MRTSRSRWLAVLVAGGLVVAACGDDDGGEEGAATTSASATTASPATSAAATTAGGSASTTAGRTGASTTSAAGGGGGACQPDTSIDATEGVNAGQFIADIECAAEKPLKAEGEPIVIGLQNPQGDPAGSFPEYSATIQAATEFINNELGGLGSDIAAGKPGRPVQLETCFMAINPADSQRCANELAGKDPFAVISSLNFFGNHFPIYEQAGVEVIVGTPITVGDFTGKAFAIGSGGGCLGTHTGMAYAAAIELGGKRIAVPWADTPPGVVCYYDLEAKPLDVLRGAVPGSSELAGTIPDLEFLGVPIKPATPDATPQATQVLDFDPDVIMYSAQGADCWTFVDALGRLGWTPDQTPLVLSGACIDFEKMAAAGALAEGVYFVGAAGSSLSSDPAGITNPRQKFETEVYQAKAAEFGASEEDIRKGFGAQGWVVMMTIWEQASIVARDGQELTPESFAEQMRSTSDNHIYGAVPFGCQAAPAPYTAVCNASVNLTRWNGTNLESVIDVYSGVDLIAGTELKPGP